MAITMSIKCDTYRIKQSDTQHMKKSFSQNIIKCDTHRIKQSDTQHMKKCYIQNIIKCDTQYINKIAADSISIIMRHSA